MSRHFFGFLTFNFLYEIVCSQQSHRFSTAKYHTFLLNNLIYFSYNQLLYKSCQIKIAISMASRFRKYILGLAVIT